MNKPVEVGGTADFSALKWAAVDTKNVAHAMGDYGLTVGYEIADVTIDGKSYGKEVANKIASVKDGVVTVASSSNQVMADLLAVAGKSSVVIKVNATSKYNAATTKKYADKLTVEVTKASDKYSDTVFTIGGRHLLECRL